MTPTTFFVRLIRSIGRMLAGFGLVQLAVGITRMVVLHTAYTSGLPSGPMTFASVALPIGLWLTWFDV